MGCFYGLFIIIIPHRVGELVRVVSMLSCAKETKPRYTAPNKVTRDTLNKLAPELAESKYSSVSLEYCDLDSDLAEIVGNGLSASVEDKSSADLVHLSLSNNPIGTAGLHHFTSFFKGCKLQSLFLIQIG